MTIADAPAPTPVINLARRRDLFSSDIVLNALKQSFAMLRPEVQSKNPVMFVVEIGAALTLLYVIEMALGLTSSVASLGYFVALDVWLWLTVLFANFATAIAEERGRARRPRRCAGHGSRPPLFACARTGRLKGCRRLPSGPATKSWCKRTRSFPAMAT
jgi:hypothetical protein